MRKFNIIQPEDITADIDNSEYIVVVKKDFGNNYKENILSREDFEKGYIGYFDFSSESVTDIETQNTWVKLNTNTVSDFKRNGLNHSNNRVTNISNNVKIVKAEGIITMRSGNNNEIHCAFYKNGNTLLPCTEQSVITSGSGRAAALPIQCIVRLEPNEYIEVWTKNQAATTNITLDNVNVIVMEL